MKTKYVAILSLLGLLAITAGGAILLPSGQTPVGASIKFEPNFIDWDSGAPSVWVAYIRCAEGYDWHPRDIDNESIRFEGVVPPVGGELVAGAYRAEFNGPAVFNALAGKVGHMQPDPPSASTPLKLYFTVTGNLNDVDETPFIGEGWIKVRFPYGYPPVPPP